MADLVNANEFTSLEVHAHASASMTATATVVANFAYQHLRSAVTFRNRACEIEDDVRNMPLGDSFEDLRCYCSGTVFMATASIEALINELYIAPTSGLRSRIPRFEEVFWGQRGIERKPTLEKYKIALKTLNRPSLEEEAYIPVESLFQFRHALSHFKPQWSESHSERSELRTMLDGRFELSPLMNETADFLTQRCMSAGCANWAVRTAFGFIRAFDRVARLDPNKMKGFWMLEEKSSL